MSSAYKKFFLCWEIKKKNSIVRGILLIGGGNLGLDRFYEGDKKGSFLSMIGWNITLVSFIILKSSGYVYVHGMKNYSDDSPSP